MASDTDFTVASQFYSHNVTVAFEMYKIRWHNFEFINFLGVELQNSINIYEDNKSRFNSGSACHQSVQSLSFHLPSLDVKISICSNYL
jgi:hypothetical protein